MQTDIPRILRIAEVQRQTGLGRSQIYTLARSGAFPRPIKLSERCSGWQESQVRLWVESRINAAAQSGKKVAA